MTRVAAALAVLCAFALPAAARADTLIEGIALGSPLAVLLKSEGLPAATAAGSTGSAIVWRTPARQTTVYVDDDGVVDAVVDVPPGGTRVRVDFDGKPVVFVTGRFTLDQADAQLAANAQYSSATMRTYEPEPGRELVLLFDEKTAALATVIYGDRGTVARMGYVKADDIATSVPFHSAILNKSAIKDAGPGPAALIAYALYASRDEKLIGNTSALLFSLAVGLLGPALYWLTTAPLIRRRKTAASAQPAARE